MRSRAGEAYSRQSIDVVQIHFMLNVGESIEAYVAQDYTIQGQSFGKWERMVRHGRNSEESCQLYSSNGECLKDLKHMTSGVMLLLRKLRLVVM